MIKKNLTYLILVIVITTLVACGKTGQNNSTLSAVGMPSGQTNTSQQGENGQMPLAMKLAFGTLMLEKSNYPVTGDQAKQLLFLWKAISSLSKSDTTANEELQAVVNQIQNTMTPEQLQAINKMDLSFTNMRSIAEELGLNFGNAGSTGNRSPQAMATMQAARSSGERPPGDFQFFGGPGGEGGFNRQALQTQSAANGGQTRNSLGINNMLLEAIIQFLTIKANG